MTTPAELLQQSINKIAGMGLPTGNVGMSGAESQAYDATAQASKQQAGKIKEADKELEAVSTAQSAAFDAMFAGIQMQAEADQAKAQQIADNNDFFNKLAGLGTDLSSPIAQMVQYKGQVIAPQLLERVQKQVELGSMGTFDDPLLGLALPDAQAQVGAQVKNLNDAGQALDAAINDAITQSQNMATRVNSAIPSITLAQKEAGLAQERAKIDAQKAGVREQRIKDSVSLLNQETDALIRANQAVIAKEGQKRDIQKFNIGQAQEAARFAMGKEQWLLGTRMQLEELKKQEAADTQLLTLANQGAKMTGNKSFESLEAFKSFQKAAPDLAERLVSFGLNGSVGSNPGTAYSLITNPKTNGMLLGGNLGPAATKAAQITVNAARSAQLSPSEMAKTKDKKEQEQLLASKINERVAAIFSSPAERANAGLSIPTTSEIFQVYSSNPAFANKFKVSADTVQALAPLAKSKAQADDRTVVQTLVTALEAKGYKPEQIATQVSTYFAGATTLRNSQVDGARFGFNNEPKIAAAMQSYEIRAPLIVGDMGIDVTKPASVKNYLLRRQTQQFRQDSSNRIPDLYGR